MSWFKKAKSPIVEFSGYSVYDTDEIDTEFKIYLNGKPYTYYGINRKEAGELRWMIDNPKIPGGVVLKRLRPYSDPKMHKKLNPDKSDNTFKVSKATLSFLDDFFKEELKDFDTLVKKEKYSKWFKT